MQSNFNIHEPLNLARPRLGMGLSLSAMIIFSALSIAKNPPLFKVYASLMGMFSGGVGMMYAEKLREHEPIRILKKEAKLELFSQLAAIQAMPDNGWGEQPYLESADHAASISHPEQLIVQQLDPIALKKRHTGLLICGDSGSAKTTLIRYCLPYWISEGYQVIVLDPHADKENPEYPWADFPYVVGDRHAIFEQIKILLELLESKERTKVICICDEWTDLLGFAQLEGREMFNILRNFLIRWGTGGRKFGKFLVGIGHTDNVEQWGLKGVGGLIRNFGIIRLGEIATRHAEFNCKYSELHQYCVQTAYPLLIDNQPTLHPTHGHYQIKENEQPPANLQPLNFHKLTIEFVGDLPINLRKAPEPRMNQSANDLNRLLSLDCGVAEPIEPIADDWDGTGDIPPHITAELVQGIRRGLSKNQIIVEILGTPKGGSKRYKSLSQYHDELRKNIL